MRVFGLPMWTGKFLRKVGHIEGVDARVPSDSLKELGHIKSRA